MTADNADGGAVPPTTHFAIKPCCLICADVQFDKGFFCHNGMRGDELSICSDFTLRDFGYPVRTVEMD